MAAGSILKDIGTYKQHLINAFINSDEICKLLFNNESYAEDDIENLIYKQVFPYLYKDETMSDVLSYLCFEVDVPKIPSRNIKDMKITIWVYCHKDLIDYSDSEFCGTKVDILSDMVDRQLRDSNKFGIGKLEMISVTNFSPANNYYGKELIYNVPDFKIKG